MKHCQQTPSTRHGVRRQGGFTLIEMMVAVTIGLIVAIGLAVSFVNLKTTWGTQDKLAQLQDNERLALVLLTNALQRGRLLPRTQLASPITGGTAPATSPVTPGGAMPDKVSIFGTADGGAATSPESLQTAYASVSTDGLISCIGTSYTGAGTVTVRNIYFVDPTTKELKCRVLVNNATTDTMANGGTPQVLVSGISKMQISYGISSAGTDRIDSYVDVGTVADWSKVKSARIQLTFINPNSTSTQCTVSRVAHHQHDELTNDCHRSSAPPARPSASAVAGAANAASSSSRACCSSW